MKLIVLVATLALVASIQADKEIPSFLKLIGSYSK